MPTKIEKGKSPAAAGESLSINPTIWKVLSYKCPDLPRAGTSVYYFCDGHIEQCQCSSVPDDLCTSFTYPCYLAAVNLHVDPITEQVFAAFTLSNVNISSPAMETKVAKSVISVTTTLTKSEANYKSRSFLTLPESAERVFGQLAMGVDVEVFDLNNRQWRFHHCYGENPRRHLLTEGWSSFASSKMLVAGDEVVFMRDDDGVILVGCRRYGDDEGGGTGEICGSSNRFCGMSRKKREDAEMVIEAIWWANDGEGVAEVRYYPDTKLPLYVVEKEVVDEAMKVQWAPGMRVGKTWETANGSIIWKCGTVDSLSPDFTDTPWRMLQVIWDATNTKTRENPWEVKTVEWDIAPKPEEQTQIDAPADS